MTSKSAPVSNSAPVFPTQTRFSNSPGTEFLGPLMSAVNKCASATRRGVKNPDQLTPSSPDSSALLREVYNGMFPVANSPEVRQSNAQETKNDPDTFINGVSARLKESSRQSIPRQTPINSTPQRIVTGFEIPRK